METTNVIIETNALVQNAINIARESTGLDLYVSQAGRIGTEIVVPIEHHRALCKALEDLGYEASLWLMSMPDGQKPIHPTPPDEWYDFGTHADRPEVGLELSEELGRDLLPLWERPISNDENGS